jgi:hypothetical protein
VILESVLDKRPQADRILIARLTGEARRRADWRELTSAEEAAAVAALHELAGGRGDLLAEVAGVGLGFSEGQMDEPLSRQAAALCQKAGADPASTTPATVCTAMPPTPSPPIGVTASRAR